MDLELSGKVAIVGGASQGIGLATARALAREGTRVTMLARREQRLNAAAATLTREKLEVMPVSADIRVADDIRNAVRATVDAYGRLDLVVNNDGAPAIGRVETFDDPAWHAAVEQNLMSVVRMVRETTPHLRASGGGSIVNVAALSVLQPRAEFGLSVSTWAGVIGLAKTLSVELGPDQIRVNTVCPGRIRTPRVERLRDQVPDMSQVPPDTPLGRLGEAAEVADLIAFLCSPRSAFVTGATLHIDGGRRANVI